MFLCLFFGFLLFLLIVFTVLHRVLSLSVEGLISLRLPFLFSHLEASCFLFEQSRVISF